MGEQYTEITYSVDLPKQRALPPELREKLMMLTAQMNKDIAEHFIRLAVGPLPPVRFEDSVWPPKPQPRCACGKCRGIVNLCGDMT